MRGPGNLTREPADLAGSPGTRRPGTAESGIRRTGARQAGAGEPGAWEPGGPGGTELSEAVWDLLHEAVAVYQDTADTVEWLGYRIERYGEPLRIAVAGAAGAGKSTVVNAIVGEQIAPVQLADGGQVLACYQAGPEPRATVYPAQGPPQDAPASRLDKKLHIDTRPWRQHQVNRVTVQWPARILRYATLIDAPVDAQLADEADAVLYLVPNLDSAALELLTPAQDSLVARAAPVNTILVLSRADEVGAGRVDALSSAALIARRYARQAPVRACCQHVVALAGLAGYAGRTLREPEFATLAQLAGAPRADLAELLLSTDRFLHAQLPAVPLGTPARRALLDRFGLFGIRLATTLIRGGCDSGQQLATELVRRSGLADLRESISRDFTDRQQVLKARSALVALEWLLRTQPRSGARRLQAGLEQVLASAHDFRELRLVAALRTGRTALPGGLAGEAEQLLGGRGTSIAARVGIDDTSTAAELRSAAAAALAHWQKQAENPVLNHEQQRAAGVVVRSCEGMLTRLAG